MRSQRLTHVQGHVAVAVAFHDQVNVNGAGLTHIDFSARRISPPDA